MSLISVIIPCFNNEKTIEETIISVIDQDYKTKEIIIIDDGSTDNSNKIIRQYSDKHSEIKCQHRTRAPKGANTCRNIGINSAQGDYIVFLDADDLLAPNCLSQRSKVMDENQEMDFGIFMMKHFYIYPGDCNNIVNVIGVSDPITGFLSFNNPWPITATIWRKKSLVSLNGLNENYSRLQDLELHLRALFKGMKYGIFYDRPVDCYYRISYKHKDENKKKHQKKMVESYLLFMEQFYGIIIKANRKDYIHSLRRSLRIIIKNISDISLDVDDVINLLLKARRSNIINLSKMLMLFVWHLYFSFYKYIGRKIKYIYSIIRPKGS